MGRDFVQGQTYTMAELGTLQGGVVVTSEDRIVVPDELRWSRMTAGRLRLWLEESVESGAITPETEVWIDSDPEGNDRHPMRASFEPYRLIDQGTRNPAHPTTRVLDEESEEVDMPFDAVCFGAGY